MSTILIVFIMFANTAFAMFGIKKIEYGISIPAILLSVGAILLVALITSVIVNFYTEVKNDDEAPAEDGRKPSAPAEDGLKDE